MKGGVFAAVVGVKCEDGVRRRFFKSSLHAPLGSRLLNWVSVSMSCVFFVGVFGAEFFLCDG